MALTPDAVSTNEELVESFLDRVYHPHKKAIWAGIVLFLAAIVAFLGMTQYRAARLDDMWARYRDAAGLFELNPSGESDTAAARKQIEALQILVKDYPDEAVTPFALQQLAKAQVGVGEYENALKTLEDLRTRFKDFPLNTLPADADSSGRARSLAQKLEDAIKRERDWSVKRNYVHHWPAEDHLALVETTAGSFWMGFYSDPNEAPKHVESFIGHAKNGDYNATQVYMLLQSVEGTAERFECGSKASKPPDLGGIKDPAEHDRDEPTDTIDPEDTRSTMRHEYRVVSAVKMDSGESGTRFVVVAKRNGLEKLNGETTPFAAVIDREKSLETIDKIGRASTYAVHPDTKDKEGVYRMRDHPYPAIYIRRVSIFTKEKLEEGHMWDTARVGTDQPEPWEKGLTSPLPDEFKLNK